VLGVLVARIPRRVHSLVQRARNGLLAAGRPKGVLAGAVVDRARTPGELLAENALPRQQLIVAVRSAKRPQFRAHERGLLLLLARAVPGWRDALLLVKPETLLRWHREGFRIFWKRRTATNRSRVARVDAATIALIACVIG
jgi:hypothetical protein